MTISGKALLVLTRRETSFVNEKAFDVSAYIQSCSGCDHHRDVAEENFQHLEYDVLPIPDAAHKLKMWETVRVSVVFEFSFSQDYYGEVDVDLDYHKQRVLRRQRPKPYYESKKAHG